MHQSCIKAFILLGLVQISISAMIANDVVNDYAEVKELLAAFYRRHAKKFGHDYDPATIQAVAENMDKSIKEHKIEATVNRKLWNEVFENDIILTLPQAEALLSESHSPISRAKRQANLDRRNFWPNLTISYEFYGGEDSWRSLIRSAIQHVEANVCFRFKENGGDRDGLRYYRGNGCWSNVGRIGGKQLVSIGYGCENKGIVSHETLHALGLWHEQSRDDRDNYITIDSSKITRGTEGNFAKRTPQNSENLGQPYDLGSVMHYGAKAFAFDWTSDTILTNDERYQNTLGQRDGLSFKDAKMINTRYCQDVCPRKLPCVNEGYTDPNNCSKCRCPTGYGGTYCEDVEYSSCGGNLIADSNFKTIKSGMVLPNQHCVWRIRNPGGTIELNFDSLNFQCSDPCTNYAEIKWLKQKTSTGARFCCDIPATIRSENDDVLVIYKTDASAAYGWRGFTLNYRAIGGHPTVSPAPVTSAITQPTVRPDITPYWTRTRNGWIHYERTKLYAPDGSTWMVENPDEFSPSNEPPAQEHDLSSITTTTTTTTTTSTTTVEPETTSTSSASWGSWGDWSACSQPCGGCGTRTRVRGCYGGDLNCSGSNITVESCNTQTCAKPKKGMICNGRLLLPCDLLSKLTFGSNNYLNPKLKQSGTANPNMLPLPRVSQRAPFYAAEGENTSGFAVSSTTRRLKRQTANRICEKKFIYNCPTGLLTIEMEYKKPSEGANDAYFQEYPECCSGYWPRGGQCYKNK